MGRCLCSYRKDLEGRGWSEESLLNGRKWKGVEKDVGTSERLCKVKFKFIFGADTLEIHA